MNKSFLYGPNRPYLISFIICAALFVCGCVAGCIASGGLSPQTPVAEYLSALTPENSANFGTRFLASLGSSGKYHLVVLFFAFTVFGVAVIPLIMAFRGFLICFTAASIIRFFGTPSILYTVLLFASEALIAIPCLFLLSSQSLIASGSLLKISLSRTPRPQAPYGNGFVQRSILCGAFICIGALLHTSIGPWVAGRLIL